MLSFPPSVSRLLLYPIGYSVSDRIQIAIFSHNHFPVVAPS